MEIKHKPLALVMLAWLFLTAVAGIAATSSQAREYLRKARVFFERGRLKEARDYYNRARKIEPDSSEIAQFGQKIERELEKELAELRRRGDFFLSAKNIPEAEKTVRQLLILAPDDDYGQKQMAAINEVKEKVQEYQSQGIVVAHGSGRAHDVDLYNAISLLNRARGFLDNGEREKALVLVEQVLAREPGYKTALALKEKILYVNRIQEFIDSAETAFHQGKMRECIDSLDKLIKESPERTEYLLLRGRAHLKLKDYEPARRDFWAYFKLHPDEKKLLFAFLAETYYGLGRMDMAMALAKDPLSGENYQSLSFQYRCMFRHYALEYSVLAALVLIFPGFVYFAYRKFDVLVNRFPPGRFYDGVNLVRAILFSGPDKYLPLLIEVARGLNIAWLNYYAGICLFRAGQLEGAQRFLAYSFSNQHLAGRAYYFFGLTRKLLEQQHYDNDFDASIVASMARRTRGWHPEFVKRIERQILKDYSVNRESESYEGMACLLVSSAIGEVV